MRRRRSTSKMANSKSPRNRHGERSAAKFGPIPLWPTASCTSATRNCCSVITSSRDRSGADAWRPAQFPGALAPGRIATGTTDPPLARDPAAESVLRPEVRQNKLVGGWDSVVGGINTVTLHHKSGTPCRPGKKPAVRPESNLSVGPLLPAASNLGYIRSASPLAGYAAKLEWPARML